MTVTNLEEMKSAIQDEEVERAFKLFMEGTPDKLSAEELKEMFQAARQEEAAELDERGMLRYLLARGKIAV